MHQTNCKSDPRYVICTASSWRTSGVSTAVQTTQRRFHSVPIVLFQRHANVEPRRCLWPYSINDRRCLAQYANSYVHNIYNKCEFISYICNKQRTVKKCVSLSTRLYTTNIFEERSNCIMQLCINSDYGAHNYLLL